ncbi:MAG: 3-dehydroquinate synthase [Nanoarchaeota archaeon]|nr:3-dehydroquinate synthase [Nanoarchaeota archaeon]
MVEIQGNKLRLNLQRQIDESYDLVFGKNLFPEIAEYLQKRNLAASYAIVTDSNVRNLHASELELCLKELGLQVKIFSFPAGEINKTMDNCLRITGEMSRANYGRDSAILALGGGVVGDMAGFMAAIFNRGIPYIQIPTTVLAQADSAVGGKTGVDTEWGKNLLGSFKQPEIVYVDIATLKTLPDQELRNGLAETIKHAIIRDVNFFDYLERNIGLILNRDTGSTLEIARTNCRIKGEVVEIDPHERGLRKILNYGHTAGHAVEKLSNFSLSHGYCVAIGMMVAGRIARALGHFSQSDLERQQNLILRAGLPIYIPREIDNEGIINLTARDKKAKNATARYCLPTRIGEMKDFEGDYSTPVEGNIVIHALNETRAN